jgi:hypothetical protein
MNVYDEYLFTTNVTNAHQALAHIPTLVSVAGTGSATMYFGTIDNSTHTPRSLVLSNFARNQIALSMQTYASTGGLTKFLYQLGDPLITTAHMFENTPLRSTYQLSKMRRCMYTNNMFYNCINFSGFGSVDGDNSTYSPYSANLPNVRNCSAMFYNCSNYKINTITLSTRSWINVVSAAALFYNCCNMPNMPDLSPWTKLGRPTTAANVLSVVNMFYNCYRMIGNPFQLSPSSFGNISVGSDSDLLMATGIYNNCVNLTDFTLIGDKWK